MIKECTICSDKFEAKQSSYKVCSKSCRKIHYKNNLKDYYKDNRDEFIRKAAILAKIEPTRGKCIICSSEFMGRKNSSCCGEKCRSVLNNIKTIERYHKIKKVYDYECKNCSATFTAVFKIKVFCSGVILIRKYHERRILDT